MPDFERHRLRILKITEKSKLAFFRKVQKLRLSKRRTCILRGLQTAWSHFTHFAKLLFNFEFSKRRIYILRGLHTATKFSAVKKKWHFFHIADFPTQYANRVGSLSAWNIYIYIIKRSSLSSTGILNGQVLLENTPRFDYLFDSFLARPL